ncbi:hypothetical protein VKT23_016366 [Stygiomarasmius scandens]|uniref:Uncharacterized protein n=1 Tax=Marasmiellus scandens TaxID=2682957 RepID=A0ABR1ISX3_9AGAR
MQAAALNTSLYSRLMEESDSSESEVESAQRGKPTKASTKQRSTGSSLSGLDSDQRSHALNPTQDHHSVAQVSTRDHHSSTPSSSRHFGAPHSTQDHRSSAPNSAPHSVRFSSIQEPGCCLAVPDSDQVYRSSTPASGCHSIELSAASASAQDHRSSTPDSTRSHRFTRDDHLSSGRRSAIPTSEVYPSGHHPITPDIAQDRRSHDHDSLHSTQGRYSSGADPTQDDHFLSGPRSAVPDHHSSASSSGRHSTTPDTAQVHSPTADSTHSRCHGSVNGNEEDIDMEDVERVGDDRMEMDQGYGQESDADGDTDPDALVIPASKDNPKSSRQPLPRGVKKLLAFNGENKMTMKVKVKGKGSKKMKG